MKKGFTLIELLSVIVILAIIVLIATPIILNIINSTKEQSNERSIELYAKAVKEAVVRHQMNKNESVIGEFAAVEGTYGKQIQQGETTLNIDYDGNVICQTVMIDQSGAINLTGCKVNNGKTNYIYNGEVVVVPATVSFKEDDWSTIIANVQAGNTSVYNVGDTKKIILTSDDDKDGNNDHITTGEYEVRIANKPDKTDEEEKKCGTEGFSETACGFVIEFVDIITTYSMNSSSTNVGGWQDSAIRTYVNGTIYETFPKEIKENIIPTTVVSGYGSNDSSNFITTDKLYLLSTKEVWGSNSGGQDTATSETRQLDYYENLNVTTSNYTGAIKRDSWWLRTPHSGTGYSFIIVEETGGDGKTHSSAYNFNGVAPAFRLSE